MKRQRIAALLLATTVMSQVLGSQVTYAKSEVVTSKEYSLKDASTIALNHMKGLVNSSDKNVRSKDVKKEPQIVSSKALFDLNENVSAYLFKIGDNEGKSDGYVILSAKTNDCPIIEYGFGDSCFVDKALETTKKKVEKSKAKSVKKNNSKVYYLGGLTYIAQHKLEDDSIVDYNISDPSAEQVDKDEYSDYKEEPVTRSASRNDIIEWPSECESGNYNSVSTYTITKGYRNYWVMSDFSDGGVCSPTAATNLMYYWYNRDSKKYSKLMNKSWKNTFSTLYKYMGTTKSKGTSDSKVAPAVQKYLRERGFKSSTASFYKGTSSGQKIVNVLNGNKPCQLMVHRHPTYGDHSVLAIGYQQFHYDKGVESTYIQIEDGWINKPYRYVWGLVKGYWNYVTVNIK